MSMDNMSVDEKYASWYQHMVIYKIIVILNTFDFLSVQLKNLYVKK